NVTCWMFRLSAAGELLWMREYVYWDAYAQLMFLYGITEDPYGNIAATGYAVAPNEEGVLDEQAVLLKVNNMGCLSADCNDDIIINSVIGNTAAVPIPLHSAPALQIYPNPANQTATLLLPAACHNKEVQVILYNIRGKEVQQLNSKGQPQVLISNDNLPAAGIYICKVFTQNGYIGTVKLLLE
ncbi:hypothetical protein C7N43_30280, partial [Sphingobacteriales bacterium UPWRP_1]